MSLGNLNSFLDPIQDCSRQIRDKDRNLKSWQTPPIVPHHPILLNHCLTNAYLSCYDDRKKYLLDDACQVFSTTDIDHRKYECYQWSIVPVAIHP